MYISHSNDIGGSLVAESCGSTVPVFNPPREMRLSESPSSSADTGCRPDMDIMKREIFGAELPIMKVSGLDEAVSLDTEYGLTSSIDTTGLTSAMHAVKELSFGETYVNRENVNRENFEAIQGFHAGVRKSGIGGADGKHGVYEYTTTHIAYIQA